MTHLLFARRNFYFLIPQKVFGDHLQRYHIFLACNQLFISSNTRLQTIGNVFMQCSARNSPMLLSSCISHCCLTLLSPSPLLFSPYVCCFFVSSSRQSHATNDGANVVVTAATLTMALSLLWWQRATIEVLPLPSTNRARCTPPLPPPITITTIRQQPFWLKPSSSLSSQHNAICCVEQGWIVDSLLTR
jgi:hypothetical protein